jgi:hypothetical protein
MRKKIANRRNGRVAVTDEEQHFDPQEPRDAAVTNFSSAASRAAGSHSPAANAAGAALLEKHSNTAG